MTPSFSDGIELSPTRNKFLAREKTRARMHDIRTEFLVRVYRTSFLDGELGSSVMGFRLLGCIRCGLLLQLQRGWSVGQSFTPHCPVLVLPPTQGSRRLISQIKVQDQCVV